MTRFLLIFFSAQSMFFFAPLKASTKEKQKSKYTAKQNDLETMKETSSDEWKEAEAKPRNLRPHHFFNAELLEPGEKQISIASNFKYGLTPEWELGTNALVSLLSAYNLSIKHQMFRRPKWKTAFITHTFFSLSLGGSSPTDTSSDSSSSKDSGSLIFAPTGIITTIDITDNGRLSWGFYDFYLRTTSSSDHSVSSLHMLSPSISWDGNISDDLTWTASLTYPLWLIGALQSDEGDLEVNLNITQGIPTNLHPSMGFLTITKRWNSFHFEGGLITLMMRPSPYINLFWRLP